jgi:hypothetical protein
LVDSLDAAANLNELNFLPVRRTKSIAGDKVRTLRATNCKNVPKTRQYRDCFGIKNQRLDPVRIHGMMHKSTGTRKCREGIKPLSSGEGDTSDWRIINPLVLVKKKHTSTTKNLKVGSQ